MAIEGFQHKKHSTPNSLNFSFKIFKSDYNHPSKSTQEEEFSLILIDKFKLECDLPIKKEFVDPQYRNFREKNNGEATIIQMNDRKWILNLLFFNKLFQINLNW